MWESARTYNHLQESKHDFVHFAKQNSVGGYHRDPSPQVANYNSGHHHPFQDVNKLSCGTQFLRFTLVFINFIFIIAGLLGVAVGALWIHGKHLGFCPACASIAYVSVTAFGCLFLFSLLGLCGLWKRCNSRLIANSVFLVIFFSISLGVGVTIVLVQQRKLESPLRKSWEDFVDDHPVDTCDFESQEDCSGWDKLCNELQFYANSTATVVPSKQCAPCLDVQARSVVGYATTCKDKLHGQLDTYYLPLIIVIFSLAGLSLFSLIASFKLRRDFTVMKEGAVYESDEYSRV